PHAVRRQVTAYAFNPAGVSARRMTFGGKSTVVGSDEASVTKNVCVPPDRPADVALRADGLSSIPSSPSSVVTANRPRTGGLLISRVYLSGQIGARCRDTPPSR